MPFCIQYNPTTGAINATVNTSGEPPVLESQLVFDEYVDTAGKMVDVNTKTLIDKPPQG